MNENAWRLIEKTENLKNGLFPVLKCALLKLDLHFSILLLDKPWHLMPWFVFQGWHTVKSVFIEIITVFHLTSTADVVLSCVQSDPNINVINANQCVHLITLQQTKASNPCSVGTLDTHWHLKTVSTEQSILLIKLITTWHLHNVKCWSIKCKQQWPFKPIKKEERRQQCQLVD